MPHRVTLIPGDGIGPEITEAAIEVIAATGVKIDWDRRVAGQKGIEQYNQPLPDVTLRSIRKNKVALKGPLMTPIAKGFQSVNVLLRKTLQLYANLRPAKSLAGIPTRYKNIDLVILRENTEDLYTGIEHVVAPGVVESIKIITRKASERIARYAFEYAMKNGRKKVTAIHKANIMKLSDGLFLDSARRIAKKYPKIQFDDKIVDNACMQLVTHPTQFDILLLENLYGDIVSDLTAGLVGGLGVVPAANIGKSGAIFEAVHGTAPDIAGQGKANPIALVLSSAMMLDHLGESRAAAKVWHAVNLVLKRGTIRTPDLGGTSSTSDMAVALCRAV